MYELGEKVVIRSNPKSFMMGVALNLYRNQRRKVTLRQRITGSRVSVDETVDRIGSEGLEAEALAVAEEERRIVREAVLQLPDKYRIPVLLCYMEELSMAEIAAFMHMPEGTIKTRIHRAKKILRERLEVLL